MKMEMLPVQHKRRHIVKALRTSPKFRGPLQTEAKAKTQPGTEWVGRSAPESMQGIIHADGTVCSSSRDEGAG